MYGTLWLSGNQSTQVKRVAYSTPYLDLSFLYLSAFTFAIMMGVLSPASTGAASSNCRRQAKQMLISSLQFQPKWPSQAQHRKIFNIDTPL